VHEAASAIRCRFHAVVLAGSTLGWRVDLCFTLGRGGSTVEVPEGTRTIPRSVCNCVVMATAPSRRLRNRSVAARSLLDCRTRSRSERVVAPGRPWSSARDLPPDNGRRIRLDRPPPQARQTSPTPSRPALRLRAGRRIRGIGIQLVSRRPDDRQDPTAPNPRARCRPFNAKAPRVRGFWCRRRRRCHRHRRRIAGAGFEPATFGL
jgi:hypothetical protein